MKNKEKMNTSKKFLPTKEEIYTPIHYTLYTFERETTEMRKSIGWRYDLHYRSFGNFYTEKKELNTAISNLSLNEALKDFYKKNGKGYYWVVAREIYVK